MPLEELLPPPAPPVPLDEEDALDELEDVVAVPEELALDELEDVVAVPEELEDVVELDEELGAEPPAPPSPCGEALSHAAPARTSATPKRLKRWEKSFMPRI
ncbi:Hypothetical protein A7982_00808 [Minicystis rosea]|nr:Hypothetical protein A7982_00808 [Minicystis rosea]